MKIRYKLFSAFMAVMIVVLAVSSNAALLEGTGKNLYYGDTLVAYLFLNVRTHRLDASTESYIETVNDEDYISVIVYDENNDELGYEDRDGSGYIEANLTIYGEFSGDYDAEGYVWADGYFAAGRITATATY